MIPLGKLIATIIRLIGVRSENQLIDKLADSAPIRRTARSLVAFYMKTRSILPSEISTEKLKQELKSEKVQGFAKKVEEMYEKTKKKF